MTDIPLFTLTDPKQTRLLYAVLGSDYCINYNPIVCEDGKTITSIEVVLDIEHENVYKLLEAYKQHG